MLRNSFGPLMSRRFRARRGITLGRDPRIEFNHSVGLQSNLHRLSLAGGTRTSVFPCPHGLHRHRNCGTKVVSRGEAPSSRAGEPAEPAGRTRWQKVNREAIARRRSRRQIRTRRKMRRRAHHLHRPAAGSPPTVSLERRHHNDAGLAASAGQARRSTGVLPVQVTRKALYSYRVVAFSDGKPVTTFRKML
jgi:hypothetical protein